MKPIELEVQPLTPVTFAEFGIAFEAPSAPGRVDYSTELVSVRPAARPSFTVVQTAAARSLPLRLTQLERHAYSSQTFLPIVVSRWLIIVCPHALSGGPDIERACAFLAGPAHAITLRMNVWHHQLTVLDSPARFSVLMWRDGSNGDEEFVTVEDIVVRNIGPANF